MAQKNNALSTYVIEAANEGCDHQIALGGGRYQLLRDGHSVVTSKDPFWSSLTDADYQRLSRAAGFIVGHLSSGTHEVEMFDSHIDLRSRWNGLRAAA